MDTAEAFLYFFVETFFDEELIRKIEEKTETNPEIKIKIITRPAEKIRQAPQKAKNMISQLLSLGVEIGNLEDAQGKFWVSDNWLAISSGDFNRMNLGHEKGKEYWRADTQLIILDERKDQITRFKNIFDQLFKPIDIGSLFRKDVETSFKRLTIRYGIKGSKDAQEYVARLKTSLFIKTERDMKYVINLAIKLTKIYSEKKVKGIFVLMAIILYHLQRREQKLDEIEEKLDRIADKPKVGDAINRLLSMSFILISEDVYRVNIERIFT